MKLVKVSELKGGEILARPILTDTYQLIQNEETLIKEITIERLKELNIEKVYIKDPELVMTEEVILFKSDLEKNVKEKIEERLKNIDYSHNAELYIIASTADKIIEKILDEDEVVEKIYQVKDRSFDVYEHSVNLCSLATLSALKLNLPEQVVHDIGVGCLLHDIGLKYLTFEYDDKDISLLSTSELNEYMKHPVYGYSILKNESWLSNLSKNIILYHHESLDGSGYPLHAKDIPYEIGIVTVCDVFDEMICGIGRQKVKIYEAVEFLKAFRDVKFYSKAIDTLLGFMAVYPIGSNVILSDGSIGKVIRQNADFVDRPVILLSKDAKGNIIPRGREIDLIKVNNLFIEKELK